MLSPLCAPPEAATQVPVGSGDKAARKWLQRRASAQFYTPGRGLGGLRFQRRGSAVQPTR